MGGQNAKGGGHNFVTIQVPVSGENLNMLNQFSRVAAPIMDRMLNNTGNQTLSMHRNILLPKLMSGEIRVRKFAEGTA